MKQHPVFSLAEQRCPSCGSTLLLARREPHPAHGLPHELATLECPKDACGVVAKIAVGADRSTGPLELVAA